MANQLQTYNPIARLSLTELMQIEGIPIDTGLAGSAPSGYAFSSAVSPGVNGFDPGTVSSNVAVFTHKPALTKRTVVDRIAAWTSEALNVRIEAGGTNNVWLGVFSGNKSFDGVHLVSPQKTFGMTVKGRLTGTGNCVASICARGISVSADVEYDARYTMMLLADSNTELTSCEGATIAWDAWSWRVKRALALNDNLRIRIVDKSHAGYTTTDYDNFRKDTLLELPYQPSMIWYFLGTNNPGRVADTQYAADLTTNISYKNHRYPNSTMVVVGPPPNGESTAKQTLLAAQRTSAQSIIAAANSGVPTYSTQYIEYVNFGDLWDMNTGLDSTSTQCYTSSSVDANGKLHGNLYGQSLFGNRAYSIFHANSDRVLKKLIKSY
jgi:hypothetical protein